MFTLTSHRAKEENNEQSFSAQEIGKKCYMIGKGTEEPLAGTQMEKAFVQYILATANKNLNA